MSGQVVSRTGQVPAVPVLTGLVLLTVGLFLMTNLRADTPDLILSLWMFIAGAGVGPIFAVFTIIVQNSVPFQELGAATSDLTLFRQIGTTLGLTLAFTLFRNNLTWGLLHDQIVAAGAPANSVPTTPPAGFDLGALTSVGSAGSNPLAFVQSLPAQTQQIFITGFHDAFTIAIANSMYLGVAAAAVAVVAALFVREIPLRGHQPATAARATTQEPSAAV